MFKKLMDSVVLILASIMFLLSQNQTVFAVPIGEMRELRLGFVCNTASDIESLRFAAIMGVDLTTLISSGKDKSVKSCKKVKTDKSDVFVVFIQHISQSILSSKMLYTNYMALLLDMRHGDNTKPEPIFILVAEVANSEKMPLSIDPNKPVYKM